MEVKRQAKTQENKMLLLYSSVNNTGYFHLHTGKICIKELKSINCKLSQNILSYRPLQTIIVTAHRPSVLSMCDRVYKIQSGHIDEVNEEQIQTFLEEG